MKKFLSYLLPVLLCIAMGWIASLLQTSALIEWYPTLNHSPLSPPAYIFPIAWAILYVLMGLSIGSLISRGDMSLVKLWLFQLLVNFLWSITFFALRSPFAGLITILILDVAVLTYIIYAFARRALAAWLFIPYFLWLLFATYLSGYIYINNFDSTYNAYAQTAPATAKKSITYTLPPLHYAHDALAPLMSSETIDYHYGKHLRGYVDNLNRLIVSTPYEGLTLDQLVVQSDGALFNNAAQVWNHTLFFDGLTPSQGEIPDGLEHAIVRDFGSVEEFRRQFTQAANSLFGSGWVWLVENDKGELSIITTTNADNPLRRGLNPLLTLDVWEHAYYIDHRNRRADFIEAWWGLVDWEQAERRMLHNQQ